MKPIVIRPPYFILLTPMLLIFILLYWMKNVDGYVRIGLAILLTLLVLFFGWKSIKIGNNEILIRKFLGVFSRSILLEDVTKVYLGKGINPSLPFTIKIYFKEKGVLKSEQFNFESRKENLVRFLSQVLVQGIQVELAKNDLCESIYKKSLKRING